MSTKLKMNRSERFCQRVEIERRVLGALNKSRYGSQMPMVGLTALGIENWITRAKPFFPEKKLESIGDILRSIAIKTGLIADNSRAVFDPGVLTSNPNVNTLLKKLESQLEDQIPLSPE